MGLYDPEEGCVTIDGRPVNAAQRRECFSAVFSDLTLFAELPPGADPRRATQLLADLGLAHRVSIENGSFTHIDKPSQGQRKRLALASALLEDRPIFLFDEWAADQDPAFRERFYQDILPSLKRQNKIVIAISHDDRWFHLADQLITLEYGSLRTASMAV